LKLIRIEPDAANQISFTFDGEAITAVTGDTIAAALLAAGITHSRNTPVSGSARAPFCMMGSCYDCLVEIDGIAVQACMTCAMDGMQVQRPALAAAPE